MLNAAVETAGAAAAAFALVLLLPVRGGASRVRPLPAAPTRGWSGHREGVTDAADLLSLVELVSAQVQAGASPARAWRVAHEVLGLEAGDDPVVALGALASTGQHAGNSSGVPAAAAAIACGWRLAERTGAPLAEVLDSVASSLRQEATAAAEVDAELAGPRATVRLLSGLPLAGIALGQAIGAHPVTVLLHTGPGRWSAVLGVLLLLVGRGWMRRLVAAVTDPA